MSPKRVKMSLRAWVLFACASSAATAQDAGSVAKSPDAQDVPQTGFVADAKAYFTAPLHWDEKDWLYFGGTLAAIAASHHYDDQVRRHFTTGQYAGNLTSQSSSEGKDAIPAVAAVAATWVYASFIEDNNGRREAAEMVEAAVLSGATTVVLRLGIGRERPNETDDSNRWGAGSNSLPSLHSTAAFAIGTVLAESGSDDVRWIRRVLGYGLGAFTSYQRLKHNAHWLSDTVAGAGLGIATAHFVMNRHAHPDYSSSFNVMPIEGGAMLTYSATFP